MIRNNRISVPFTPAMTANVLVQLGNLTNILPPLLNLTPDERNLPLKMGNAQYGLMDQVHGIMVQNPLAMPAYHTLVDFNAKITNVQELEKIRTGLLSKLQAIDDTLLVAKGEAMILTYDCYQSLKQAAKSALPGLAPLVKEVRQNFIHSAGHTPEEEMPKGDTEDSGSMAPS
jgi:hypothetical protein